MPINNNNSNNNELQSSTPTGSLILRGGGIAGAVGLGGWAFKDYQHKKILDVYKKMVEHSTLDDYAMNKFLDLKSQLKAKYKGKKFGAGKVPEEYTQLGRYRKVAKVYSPYYMDYGRIKNEDEKQAINRLVEELQQEFEKEKADKIREIEAKMGKLERGIKPKLIGAGASAVGALALPFLYEKFNKPQLEKQSGFFGDDLDEDTQKKMEAYIGQNKSSYIPFVAPAMFTAGVVASKIGDKEVEKINRND